MLASICWADALGLELLASAPQHFLIPAATGGRRRDRLGGEESYALFAGGKDAEVAYAEACDGDLVSISKMPRYSRCLVPTCPRLLQVMPDDVSPRDDQYDDHRENRDRFEILGELRRVHARPP